MKVSLGAEVLAMPTPVWIVGSYGEDDKPNAMTIAWGGVCCSKPPCVAVSLRKATHTYGNVMRRKAFTVSVPSEQYAKEADYFGMASGRDVDKFQVTGLTPEPSQVVDAPYVKEFPLVLECRLLHTLEIGLHTQFVGEIVDVKADQDVLVDGRPALDKVMPLLYGTGSKMYYKSGPFLGKGFSIGRGYMA